MKVTLILHCADREELLYDGVPSDCPPIPQMQAEIECDGKLYRLEGLRYIYKKDAVSIHLLA